MCADVAASIVPMTKTIEIVRETWTERGDVRSPGPVDRRIRVAEALAFIGLLAAFIGALGPAHHVRSTYSWPPSVLPDQQPSRTWYTPLLVVQRYPETISATLPCSKTPTLPTASSPVTVLATARFPERANGLLVTRDTSLLTVYRGERLLARVPLSRGAKSEGDCSYRLQFGDGRWSLSGGPNNVERGRDLERMPTVNGLFSELDLQSRPSLAVEVTTPTHTTRARPHQAIAWGIAALFLVFSLVLISFDRMPRVWFAVRQAARQVRANVHVSDATVAAGLVAWWVLAPSHWDDGWAMARMRQFSASGGFSNYYDSLGTNLPNGYWLDWLQHWFAQSSSSLLVLRIPALVCLAATWVLTRWIFRRLVDTCHRAGDIALWALASAFLAGAFAWGMTLRPEPATALLVTGVMACVVSFLDRERAAPLAVAVILISLAVTAHHAGFTAAAPLVIIAPRLLTWIRANGAATTTLAIAAVGLGVTLAFVGSDIAQKSVDAAAIRAYAIPDAWFDELRRYGRLSDLYGGPPMRRGSFALMALAVLAFVARPRGERTRRIDLPAATLAVMFLLLFAAPSKWPWHFGALIGVGAVAVAAETHRLRGQARAHGWSAPFLALGAVVVAIAWVWGPRKPWTVVDLSTLEWRLGFERALSLSTIAAGLPLLLAGALLLASVAGAGSRSQVPWRVVCATAPLIVVPIVVFTFAVLSVDTAKSGWTPARQNLGFLNGRVGCGLADELMVPSSPSMTPLEVASQRESSPIASWVPASPIRDASRFALGPISAGSISSPWFKLPHAVGIHGRVGFFAVGVPTAESRLQLEWGRSRSGRVERVGRGTVDVQASTSGSQWRFIAAKELPRLPNAADVARITLRNDVAPGPAAAVTSLVSYSDRTLGPLLAQQGMQVWVHPSLVTYIPCTMQPLFRDGVADVPGYAISKLNSLPLGYSDSPFGGVTDLYELERVTLIDSENAPLAVRVYRVHTRIRGAGLLRPDKTSIVS
jgi:hypothetical protein